MENEEQELKIVVISGHKLCEMLTNVIFVISTCNEQGVENFKGHYIGHIEQLVTIDNGKGFKLGLDRLSAMLAEFRALCPEQELDFEAMEQAINKEQE